MGLTDKCALQAALVLARGLIDRARCVSNKFTPPDSGNALESRICPPAFLHRARTAQRQFCKLL